MIQMYLVSHSLMLGSYLGLTALDDLYELKYAKIIMSEPTSIMREAVLSGAYLMSD